MARVRPLRRAVQAGWVGLTALVALNAAYLARLADQLSSPGAFLSRLAELGLFPFGPEAGTLSVEDYCPFGPVEGVIRFVQTAVQGHGVSFVGPVTLRNLGVFLATVVLVVVTKKTFCSWICPFGALFEWLGALGQRLGVPRWQPKSELDRKLRRGRYGMLVVVVAATAWAGTLLFKEVDPFYALFSLGADPRPWISYAILAALLAGSLALPGLWCHYLCPLGGLLDPLSRIGLTRLVRTDRCTHCGACARACPQRIPVPKRAGVTDALCTNCLECLDACPADGALELRLEARP